MIVRSSCWFSFKLKLGCSSRSSICCRCCSRCFSRSSVIDFSSSIIHGNNSRSSKRGKKCLCKKPSIRTALQICPTFKYSNQTLLPAAVSFFDLQMYADKQLTNNDKVYTVNHKAHLPYRDTLVYRQTQWLDQISN